MIAIVSGFSTIAVAIVVGWWLGHRKILTSSGTKILADTSFYVGAPALLFLVMTKVELARIFSPPVLVNVVAVALMVLLVIAVSMSRRTRRSRDSVVMDALLAGYVNSANIGLPIALYVLHDISVMAPILLFQVCFLQPLALTVLDASRSGGVGLRYLWLPLSNPMTVATFAGLAFRLTGWHLPSLVSQPIELLAQLAIPTMLLAFGASMHWGESKLTEPTRVWALVASKVVVHPLLAWLLATFVFGLEPAAILACTVIAGLPSANNIFLISVKYNLDVDVVRHTILWDTLASLPALLLIALLLSPGM